MRCGWLRAGVGVPYTIQVGKLSSILSKCAPDVDFVLSFELFLVPKTAALVVHVRQIFDDMVFAVEIC